MNTEHNLQVGSLVIAKRTTAVCDVGEKGVCYETYNLSGLPGWSFIFENGGNDGFSPNEVESMLEITGEICAEVVGYQFWNVWRLKEDFHRGRFAAAFK